MALSQSFSDDEVDGSEPSSELTLASPVCFAHDETYDHAPRDDIRLHVPHSRTCTRVPHDQTVTKGPRSVSHRAAPVHAPQEEIARCISQDQATAHSSHREAVLHSSTQLAERASTEERIGTKTGGQIGHSLLGMCCKVCF